MRMNSLSFLSLPEFDRDWERLDFDDSDLARLQSELMANGHKGAVIAGTNGARKIRFARRGSGKSGGIRVCYANIGNHGVVLLACAFAKNQLSNLTAAQADWLKRMISRFDKLLRGGK